MIYVRVELWPFGLKEKAKLIGEMTIGNIGGNEEWGNYEVEATDNRVAAVQVVRGLGCLLVERERVDRRRVDGSCSERRWR